MVSIVIPVYNVESYIDRCLESVVNQTYEDIEILVMEAKSTDDSLYKVIDWARKDDRFTIVSRKDGGLGPARNYAVNMAQGEFVIFLDSDDWLDYDYVEKMLLVAQNDPEIDMVLSGFYNHNEETKEISQCNNPWKAGIYEGVEIKKELILFGNNSMWARMVRRSLLQKYHLEQPALPYEDLAVHPALVVASKKIGICSQSYIHYVAERSGSLLSNKNSYYKLPEVFEWEDQELNKVINDPSEYKIVKEYYNFKHKRKLHQKIFGKSISIHDLEDCERIFARIIEKGIVLFGGFSSRWVIHRLPNGKSNLKKHFAFSSILSQMSGRVELGQADHANMFRKECMNDDVNKAFVDFHTAHKNEKILFVLDLLNECTDVIEMAPECYISKTEVLCESRGDIVDTERIVSWQNDKYLETWKTYCEHFISMLNDTRWTIFVLKNMYSTKYLQNGAFYEYEQIEQIKRKNEILEKMYEFVIEGLSNAAVISVSHELLYTDTQGQNYEPRPEYGNADGYSELARQMEIKIVESCYGENE